MSAFGICVMSSSTELLINGFVPQSLAYFYIKSYLRSVWPALWSSGQSCWLHIQRSGFDSRRYHIF
jgi:hypothetical protein